MFAVQVTHLIYFEKIWRVCDEASDVFGRSLSLDFFSLCQFLFSSCLTALTEYPDLVTSNREALVLHTTQQRYVSCTTHSVLLHMHLYTVGSLVCCYSSAFTLCILWGYMYVYVYLGRHTVNWKRFWFTVSYMQRSPHYPSGIYVV